MMTVDEVKATRFMWVKNIKENEFFYGNNGYKKACGNCRGLVPVNTKDDDICAKCSTKITIIAVRLINDIHNS